MGSVAATRTMAPSIAIAALIVAAGVVAGLVVGGAFEAAAADPSPSPSAVAAGPSVLPSPTPTRIAVRTATPKPSPTPTPRPTIAVPTPAEPGANGIAPPLPRIELPGADPVVIAAFDAAIDQLEQLRAYRFRTGISGRSIIDLSTAGLDFGADGSLVTRPERSLDVVLGFRMVEFDCSAATSSSSRIVVVGSEAWSQDDGALEPMGDESGTTLALLNELTPTGLAQRVLVPFGGGFERAGAEEHSGMATTRYQATASGIEAYAAVMGFEGDWSATAWVADSGPLVALHIEGHGDGPCDGFYAEISLRDIDDPGIISARPS